MTTRLFHIFLVAAGYWLFARLGLLLAVPPGYATAVWPPSGLALGAVLAGGYRLLPGVWLGSFAANVATGFDAGSTAALLQSLAIPAAIGLGAALQAAAACWAIQRWVGSPATLVEDRDIARFYVFAGPLGSVVNASISVPLLTSAGRVPAGDAGWNWFTWWTGDTVGCMIFTPLALMLFGEPREVWRYRFRSISLPLLIAFALAVAVFVSERSSSQQRQRQEFAHRAETIAAVLRDRLEGYSDTLLSIQGLFDASQHVTREEFHRFANQSLLREQGLQAVEWAARVTAAEREAFEQAHRAEGWTDFRITEKAADGRMVPAQPRDAYVVVDYLEPQADNPAAFGYDMASEPLRAAALRRARETGGVAATAPLTLVRETGNQKGILLAAPVFDKAVPETLAGFVTAVLRVEDMAYAVLTAAGVERQGIGLLLEDRDASSANRELFREHGFQSNGEEFPIPLDVAGRRWVARFFPVPETLSTQWSLWYVFAGGMALTGLLGSFLLILTGRTLRVESVVRERTHDLNRRGEWLEMEIRQREESEQALRASRSRLKAIIDAEPACIKVVSVDGTLLEMNPAGLKLVEAEKAEEVIGGQVIDLVAPGHKEAFQRFHERVCAGQGGMLQFEIVGCKGGRKWMETHAVPLPGEDGAPASHLAITLDITAFKEHQSHIENLAYYDMLTRLPNRTLLADRLQLALSQARRAGGFLAVCYLDLDDFKPVNDAYGHEAGDKLLVEVASRIKDALRAGDTVARLGGDEFALLLSGLESPEECNQTLARLLEKLAAPFLVSGHEVNISASIGVTLFPQDGANPDILLRHADQAMYQAKQSGRNRYHFFDAESDRLARENRDVLERIQAALHRGEFVLHYQPKVDMRLGQVIGAEALIRWRHPERGLVAPGEFIPLIEGTDFAATLGEWVITQALRQMRDWRAEGLELPVSVNVSARHLMQPEFSRHLAELLAACPEVPPQLLELEILETAALDDISRVSAVLEECHRLGVRFALDDFGTGYSSLTYLRRLPADVLKIDQSFVRDMLDDPEDLAIVSGIIGLARAFLRHVIAEGVETSGHGALLLQMGCDLAQGYGIARPMPAEDMPGWVADFTPDPRWTEGDGTETG